MQKTNAVRLTFFVKRTAFIFYGDEGSRTPVRKTSSQAFYVRRACFDLTARPSTIKLERCERNKFPGWLFLSHQPVA